MSQPATPAAVKTHKLTAEANDDVHHATQGQSAPQAAASVRKPLQLKQPTTPHSKKVARKPIKVFQDNISEKPPRPAPLQQRKPIPESFIQSPTSPRPETPARSATVTALKSEQNSRRASPRGPNPLSSTVRPGHRQTAPKSADHPVTPERMKEIFRQKPADSQASAQDAQGPAPTAGGKPMPSEPTKHVLIV